MNQLTDYTIDQMRSWNAAHLATDQFWHLDHDLLLIRNAHFFGEKSEEIPLMGYHSIMCKMGTCRGTINGIPMEMTAQTGVMTMHGDMIQIESCSTDFLFDCIILSQHFCESLTVGNQLMVLMQVPQLVLVHYPDEDWNILMQYTDMIQRALMQETNPQREHVVRHLMSARHFSSMSVQWQQTNVQEDRKSDLTMRFVQLMQECYLQHHDLSFYADSLHVTPKYLSESVKKATGRTAGQWVDITLLRDAQHLLSHTQLPVQEVAYRLGFIDQSAFGKFFKRQTGMSPRQYRAG